MKRARLLCVGEDARIRASYERLLGDRGYDVIAAGGGNQALCLLKTPETQVDAVICDYDMHDMNGAELAAKLKHYDPKVAVIMVSNCQPVLEEATHFVDAALPKGAPAELVLSEVEELLGHSAQDQRTGFGYAPLGSIVAGLAFLAILLRFVLEV
jgi:DNA-binding NtrC family response regulator